MKLGNNMDGEIDGSFTITDPSELLILITALNKYNAEFKSDKAERLATSFQNVLKAFTTSK